MKEKPAERAVAESLRRNGAGDIQKRRTKAVQRQEQKGLRKI